MKKKPKFSKRYLIPLLMGIIIFLLGIYNFMADDITREYSMNHGNGDPKFQGGYLMICGFVIIVVVLYIYYRALARYKLLKTNPTEYYRLQTEEQAKRLAHEQNMKKAEEERLALLPECPICKSKENVKRISTTERTMSIAFLGLASGKIGKQYECTKCKHKW